jgi:hypothetical protein
MDIESEDTSSSNLNNIDKSSSILKGYVNNETGSVTSYLPDNNLNIKQVMQLLDNADDFESVIIRDFQQKLSRLSESRQKLRKHAEGLLNYSK